ncbi:type VII secretion protein EssB [Bhargavaea ginsengi]|uniref:type VII secretion protein EssB n=1 Tax=Bhargavaea ginsengi TaxID=426757 RepID=UPI00203FAB87|nr:type VII secretion protein EssB [Bhargavaea ginsengi]MCM3087044.1 type VII secretion protein EssB [Bhargavaea ginsengi]
MANRTQTYMEALLDAAIRHGDYQSSFVFQTERIGLKNEAEIAFLGSADPVIRKTIEIDGDELVITAEFPERFRRFIAIHEEDEKTRWIFAGRLAERAGADEDSRLQPVICPENIVFGSGLEPHFLHWGVEDSLPPAGQDPDRVWLEVKAAAAAAVDNSRPYEDFLKHYETLDLKPRTKAIMQAENQDELLKHIDGVIRSIDQKESMNVRLPQKKWKLAKIFSITAGILLIPSIALAGYTFAYEKPKTEAITEAHESYMTMKYSDTVTLLSKYDVDGLPYVTLYELADSYVINERLTEEQKENIRSNITLKTDEDYLKYWIYIGRDEGEEAVDLARAMEDPVLLAYALAVRQEEIRSDDSLSGEEKQEMIGEMDSELEEIRKAMDELNKAEEEAEKEKEPVKGADAKDEEPSGGTEKADAEKAPEEQEAQEDAPASEETPEDTETPAP